MNSPNDLAEVGALMGDPGRAGMLSLLMDGRAHTATELAITAGMKRQTASWHLAKLTEAQLVTAEKRGRHRCYRLASSVVAGMLEAALVVAATPGRRRHRRRSKSDEAFRTARTCYDHLAGKLGVAIADSLVSRRCVLLSEDGGALTTAGARLLEGFGIDLRAIERRRRVFCRPCLDVSERRPHLAGALGAALAARCFERGWIERLQGSRTVTITEAGRRGFMEVFEITLRP
jgi:DNA-binding transcriptional ArsR family regulator